MVWVAAPTSSCRFAVRTWPTVTSAVAFFGLKPAALAVTVLEQDFRYDLASPDAILNRYLGKEIELRRVVGRDGDKTESIKGILLSNSNGRVLQS
ncbi:MAG: hypothetical protein B7Z80_12270, partial [Rhodospirillales bacterium 20-64-7]